MRLYCLRHRDRLNSALCALLTGIAIGLVLIIAFKLLNAYIDYRVDKRVAAQMDVERASLAEELTEATYLRGANRELLCVLSGKCQMQINDGGSYIMPAKLSCKDGFVNVSWNIVRKDGV